MAMRTLRDLDVVTTSGKVFTMEQSMELARLIYLRWGRNFGEAHAAYRRLMQNNCTAYDFGVLLGQNVAME